MTQVTQKLVKMTMKTRPTNAENAKKDRWQDDPFRDV